MNDSPRTTIDPKVQERLRTASAAARAQLTTWGPMRVLHGSALGLVVLGAILPIASVAQISIFLSSTNSMRFYDLGLAGWLIVVVGVALAGMPLLLRLSPRVGVAAFGLACAGLGVLLVPYALSQYIAMFAQLAAGYHCLTVAFVVLIIGFWRRYLDPRDVPVTSSTAS